MTPRLRAEQKAQMPMLLAKGAEAYGFRGDVWTASRVAEVIYRADRECVIIAITLGDSCVRRAGAANSLSSEQRNEMKKPSKIGMSSAGPPSKKSRGGAVHHRLGR